MAKRLEMVEQAHLRMVRPRHVEVTGAASMTIRTATAGRTIGVGLRFSGRRNQPASGRPFPHRAWR